MVEKNHYIELWVNGKLVEVESQDDINIRFNNVLQDPSKVTSNQGEYSFSFDLPCTSINNQIFNHANVLSKANKFRTRLKAELIADGNLIFTGSLTISSIKDGKYKVNLVSVKQNSLEDLFGETTMNQIRKMKRDTNGNIVIGDDGKPLHEPWSVPFDGAPSINAMNFASNSQVMFPLISYGAWAKKSIPEGTTIPVTREVFYGDYTSKFDIDQYNEWYYESFYPSHNLLEALKYAFETKNMVVQGDIFQDEHLKNVYMSVNLADEQVPTYNLGNPKFGYCDLNVRWVCPQDSGDDVNGVTCDLDFKALPNQNPQVEDVDLKFNCEKIRVYDMMLRDDGNTSLVNNTQTYLFQDDENIIVIPSDGFYKVSLEVDGRMQQSANLTASQWKRNSISDTPHQEDVTFSPDLKITTPIEIQLVRNYIKSDESGIELIHGSNGIIIYTCQNQLNTEGTFGDYNNYNNAFPHEKLGSSVYSSQATVSVGEYEDENLRDTASVNGIVPKDENALLCYDPAVSETFICGLTTWANKASSSKGCMAIMKDGKSWSNLFSDHKNESFYNQDGYVYRVGTPPMTTDVQTTRNRNYIAGAEHSFYQGTRTFGGQVQGIVYLKRNDVLRLVAIHRDYETVAGQKVSYETSATTHLTIEAASPRTQAELRADILNGKYDWASPSQFDVDLNLGEFFNKETKISDWIKNIQDAFDLEITQYEQMVSINKKKKPQMNASAVDIDDRVNSNQVEAKAISYPRSMAVKYKIDEDEWGAEKSAIENYGDDSIMNTDNWKDWIDRGYSTIELNDDTFVTNKSEKQLQFAYSWYDSFRYFKNEYDSEPTAVFNTPVISKYSYMIDGYDYEESRKHDGYGLTQRFWFKPQKVEGVELPIKAMDETVQVYVPTNNQGNFNLSYKNTEESILSKFFNVSSYLASNYVNVECYISPEEYNRLKNGALVKFDSDLYYVCEIKGFDASGKNKTTLTLMKKVV